MAEIRLLEPASRSGVATRARRPRVQRVAHHSDDSPCYIATVTGPPRANVSREETGLWCYKVFGILGQLHLSGLDSWLLLHPDGLVEAASEPIDCAQVYRDETDGGPSWLCKPLGMSGGTDGVVVFAVSTRGALTNEHLLSLSFVAGQPNGIEIVVQDDGRKVLGKRRS